MEYLRECDRQFLSSILDNLSESSDDENVNENININKNTNESTDEEENINKNEDEEESIDEDEEESANESINESMNEDENEEYEIDSDYEFLLQEKEKRCLDYLPSLAGNAYSAFTILNSKDYKLDRETIDVGMYVYNNELKNVHEDRFLMYPSTLFNVVDICEKRKELKLTNFLIVPPNITIIQALNKLKSNTLSLVNTASIITVFGGICFVDDYQRKEDDGVPFNDLFELNTEGKKQSMDLDVLITNYYDEKKHDVFIFSHFGSKEQYEYYKKNGISKVKCFDNDGNIEYTESSDLTNINQIDDNTQCMYTLKEIGNIVNYFSEKTKILELNIRCNIEKLKKKIEILPNKTIDIKISDHGKIVIHYNS
jgi:hypothetical protein